MKILIAGATGAVGRPMVQMLLERGHEVVGTSRSATGADRVRALGAVGTVCDALDAAAVQQTVAEHRPEVIVNQLTALSARFNPRKYEQWLRPTNELRTRGTRNLADAAVAAGTKLLVGQSTAFSYAWTGEGLKTEDQPLVAGDGGFADAVHAMESLERTTLHTDGLRGLVLRYGYFYGPDTQYGAHGEVTEMIRGRRFPIVGNGGGVFSFVHIDDAAAATVAAIERSASGVFNVVDDEPAEMRVWLPAAAQALGAKPPRKVPLWLARLATNRFVADGSVNLRGASNAKAKGELGWKPQHSWREWFQSIGS